MLLVHLQLRANGVQVELQVAHLRVRGGRRKLRNDRGGQDGMMITTIRTSISVNALRRLTFMFSLSNDSCLPFFGRPCNDRSVAPALAVPDVARKPVGAIRRDCPRTTRGVLADLFADKSRDS